MISLNKINPLNVLNAREVDHPPPYFQFLTLDLKYNIVNTIKDWINQNLKHRYYINETLVIVDGQYQVRIKIGFEDPKEASFFLLACSHLKYCSN
jgi:hypothetical protein